MDSIAAADSAIGEGIYDEPYGKVLEGKNGDVQVTLIPYLRYTWND